MSLPIFPFKCDDSQVKAGASCEKQKEVWQNINDLWTGKITLAPNSVGGLGLLADPLGLNYVAEQTEINKKLSEEAKQNAGRNIALIQDETKNKDKYLYAIALILVLGVIIFEFKNKKQ